MRSCVPRRTFLAAVCAHSVSISIGICQGYSAILIPQLNAGTAAFVIDVEQGSWLASLGAITNPIGSIVSGLCAEFYGRKRAMQLSSVPFIIGWILIAFAGDIGSLYAGRIVTGIGAGMSTASYTYVSEIADASERGRLQSLGPICASFGICLTYTLGYLTTWRHIALTSLAFALFSFISIQSLPESPAHIFKQSGGDIKPTMASYMWFRRGSSAAEREIKQLQVVAPLSRASLRHYVAVTTARPFFILVGLFLLQELAGIYAILFYAVNVFALAGAGSGTLNGFTASMLVGVLRLAMSVVGAALIGRFARRRLLAFSCACMVATLGVLLIYRRQFMHVISLPWLPSICIVANVIASMVGLLPLPWILVGELFALNVRPIMSGVVICLAQFFIFITVKIYPDMVAYLSFDGTLLVFMLAALAAFTFTLLSVPETQNRSLAEIEGHFRGKHDKYGVTNDAYVHDVV